MKGVHIMKKATIMFLFLLIILPSTLFAKNYESVTLGTLKESNLKLIYDEAEINTYKAYDNNYVVVSDLKYLGCTVNYSPTEHLISISSPTYGELVPTAVTSDKSLISKPFSIYNSGKVYINLFETQAITCNERTLIPLAALGSVGQLNIVGDACYFSPSEALPVSTTQNSISNSSEYVLNVTVLDIYWNGAPLLHPSTYTLDSYSTIERPLPINDADDCIYIASVVQSIQGENYLYNNTSYLGQLNSSMMEAYTKETTKPVLTNDYGDAIEVTKVAEAENFVNNKGLSSPTKYLVWTNIAEQRTYIFQGSKQNWSLYKTFICSTGKNKTPTPTGTFALTYKVPSFGQNKGYCCKYAFGFIGTTYLYHSIIFDKTGTYLLENKGVLGKKASDGCIRFSAENAKWFYDNMLSKTTVYIN